MAGREAADGIFLCFYRTLNICTSRAQGVEKSERFNHETSRAILSARTAGNVPKSTYDDGIYFVTNPKESSYWSEFKFQIT
jgi:hypothetical protein